MPPHENGEIAFALPCMTYTSRLVIRILPKLQAHGYSSVQCKTVCKGRVQLSHVRHAPIPPPQFCMESRPCAYPHTGMASPPDKASTGSIWLRKLSSAFLLLFVCAAKIRRLLCNLVANILLLACPVPLFPESSSLTPPIVLSRCISFLSLLGLCPRAEQKRTYSVTEKEGFFCKPHEFHKKSVPLQPKPPIRVLESKRLKGNGRYMC